MGTAAHATAVLGAALPVNSSYPKRLQCTKNKTIEMAIKMIEWYLVVADHLGMNTAEASLAALGCQVYYPRERIMVTRLSKRVKVERGLLYKYMFVGREPDISFYDISEARGVQRLLDDMDGRPAKIDADIVERFRRNERYGKYDYTTKDRRKGR